MPENQVTLNFLQIHNQTSTYKQITSGPSTNHTDNT